MSEKNKDFYVWTMAECIKSTYEWWGIDMMSMYDHVKEDFPNAALAITKMYSAFKETDYYQADGLYFETPRYVYEVIANLVPLTKQISHNSRTKELAQEYKDLNMCSWNDFVEIERIDLLMAVLLFTEEFIFEPVSSKNVILTDTKLTVYGNFVTLKVSKHKEKTYISIKIRGVILLEYVILN